MPGNATFVGLGLDALRLKQLAGALCICRGVPLTAQLIMDEYPSFDRLAEYLRRYAPVPADGKEAPVPAALQGALQAWQQQTETAANFPHTSATLRLDGPLDRVALESALHALAMRHDVLQLTLMSGMGRIHVAARAAVPLQYEDWTTLPSGEQQTRMAALRESEAARPFDLTAAPPLRAVLTRLGPQQHALAFSAHPLLIDEAALLLLIQELGALYSEARNGAAASLPPALCLVDEARAAFCADQDAEHSPADGWDTHNTPAPEPLELPLDRPLPAVRSHASAGHRRVISGALLENLRATAQQTRTSLASVLLAGYAALLSRLTGQNDLVIGVAAPQQGEACAFVSAWLPLHLRPEAGQSFAAFAAAVDESAKAHVKHAYVSPQLIHHLRWRQDLARVRFRFDDAAPSPAYSGLEAFVEHAASPAIADLDLRIVDRGDDLLLECTCSTALFSPETIARWLHALELLADDAAEHPDRPLGELRIIPDDQLETMLVGWNQTATPYPRDCSIATVFREQAAQSPEAPALVWSPAPGVHRTMTYAELDARSDVFAAWLLSSRQHGAELRVAIGMERSPELIIALLGTLKAGGMYVPIDPQYPEARLAVLLDDAQPHVLVTERRLAGRFAHLNVAVATMEDVPPETPAIVPGTDIDAGAPAYMIYTSGSTGKPKGVVVPHRGVVRLVRNTGYADFGPDETLLQLAPISFDASTLEIWGALLNGGRLVLMPGARPTPEEIGAAIRQYGMTTLWLTAALFHLMVMDHLEELRPLRQLLAGGDVLSATHVRTLLEAVPGLRLINGYGPTENTTFTCCHAIRLAELEGSSVPIGRPIANTRVYLLDQAQRPVPIGVAGELCAAGDGLALSYHRADALTAERFTEVDLPAPSGVIHERIYRTGDLGRYAPDGTIEFLGRRDAQIKIRGYRVELGEVEHAALQFADVRAAVAYARSNWSAGDEVPGDKQLALYVIPRGGAHTAQPTAALHAFLRTQLPEHMQPQAIVWIDAIPRTANGKVDYRALPTPHAATAAAPSAGIVDDVSRELASIWGHLLGPHAVDPHLSFFHAGGNSLLLVRLFARINKAFGTRLPITTIFEAETLEKLAAALRQQVEIRSLVPVQTAGHLAPVFMVHSYLLYHGLSEALGNAQPFYGLREVEADCELTIQQRAGKYIDEIRKTQPHGPYAVMGWCAAGPLTVEIARQLVDLGESMTAVILFDAWLPGYQEHVTMLHHSRSPVHQLAGIGAKLQRHAGKIAALPPEERLRYVRQSASRVLREGRDRFFVRHWKAVDALANRFHIPLPQFMYNTSLTTFAALDSYRPQPIPIRITLLRAQDTPEVAGASPACGWERVATDGVDVLWAPGDHESMFLGDNLLVTAEMVRRCLQHGRFTAAVHHQTPAAPPAAPPDGRLLHAGLL